jgi:hypothetical protein
MQCKVACWQQWFQLSSQGLRHKVGRRVHSLEYRLSKMPLHNGLMAPTIEDQYSLHRQTFNHSPTRYVLDQYGVVELQDGITHITISHLGLSYHLGNGVSCVPFKFRKVSRDFVRINLL